MNEWMDNITIPVYCCSINSLAPGKFEWNLRYLISQIISGIDDWGIYCEPALRWMPLDLIDDKSTLVQVMAWCRQATSHYLSQCWPRSLSPYGITRSQWVKYEWYSCCRPVITWYNTKQSFIYNYKDKYRNKIQMLNCKCPGGNGLCFKRTSLFSTKYALQMEYPEWDVLRCLSWS